MFLKLLVHVMIRAPCGFLQYDEEDGDPPFVPQDSGIVDENGDATKRIQSCLYHRSTVRDGRAVHDGPSDAAW
jgi:hypothetical protein